MLTSTFLYKTLAMCCHEDSALYFISWSYDDIFVHTIRENYCISETFNVTYKEGCQSFCDVIRRCQVELTCQNEQKMCIRWIYINAAVAINRNVIEALFCVFAKQWLTGSMHSKLMSRMPIPNFIHRTYVLIQLF